MVNDILLALGQFRIAELLERGVEIVGERRFLASQVFPILRKERECSGLDGFEGPDDRRIEALNFFVRAMETTMARPLGNRLR